MNVRIVILVFMIYLTTGPLCSALSEEGAKSRDVLNEEEREIIEMLEIFENYDLIDSMEMYSNMDEIKNINNNEAGNESGSKEVEP